MSLSIGSLCTGYGGLDMAVHAVLGGEPAWVADTDPGASAILAHRYPGVPNHGDIAAMDWAAAEPVDVLTAGFPCQDISCAGKRAGLREGTRSGLWSHVARAIAALRPSMVVIENVKELLSERADGDMEPCPWCLGDAGPESAMRALGAVLADLAEIGFDAEWVSVPAASAGACHLRWRVFVLAWPAADTAGHQPRRDDTFTGDGGREAGHGSRAGDRIIAADTDNGDGPERSPRRHEPGRRPAGGGPVPADAERDGREGRRGDAETRPAGGRHGSAGSGRAAADPAGFCEREPADKADTVAGGRGSRAVPSRRSAGVAAGGRNRKLAADTQGDGRDERGSEPARVVRGPDAPLGGRDAAADAERRGRDGRSSDPERGPWWGTAAAWSRPGAFGRYEAAVRRHERVFGRLVPAPVIPGRTGDPRLSPAFTEWMMGLPGGWVTDVPGLSRNAQLKALGNGVVPQQAAMALRMLLERADWQRYGAEWTLRRLTRAEMAGAS